MNAIKTGVSTTKKNLDAKSDSMIAVTEKMKQAEELHSSIKDTKQSLAEMKGKVAAMGSGGGGWGFPFYFLLFLIVLLTGVGYNRYNKLTKSHLP